MTNIAEIRQKFPQYDDMDDASLAEAIHQKYYPDVPKEKFFADVGLQPQRPKPSYMEGLTDQALQGFTGNYSDEIGAGILAARAKINEARGQHRPVSWGEAYTRNLAKTNADLDEFAKVNPKASIAAQIVGAIPTAVVPGSAIARTATLGGAAAKGLAMGGAYGAIAGFGRGRAGAKNRLKTAKDDAILTGALGAGLPVVGALAGKIGGKVGAGLTPNADPELVRLSQKAEKLGIPIYASQLSDSRLLRGTDDVLKVVPFSGRGPMDRAQKEAFSRAALLTIGEQGSRATQAVMARAKKRIGAVYDDVLGKTNLPARNGLMDDMAKVMDEVRQTLPRDEADLILEQVRRIKEMANKNGGVITGPQIMALTARGTPLTRLANNNINPEIRYYAGKLKDAVNEGVAREQPAEVAQAFRRANEQYKNMKTIEPIAAKSLTGEITSTNLLNHVIKHNPNFAYKGAGDLGDLAKISVLMKSVIPDSGTPLRTLIQSMLLGAGSMTAGIGPTVKAFGLGPTVGRLANKAINSEATKKEMIRKALKQDPYLVNQSTPRLLNPKRPALPRTPQRLSPYLIAPTYSGVSSDKP